MNNEVISSNKESINEARFSPPAIELLLNHDNQAKEAWPESIISNEKFREQVAERRTIIKIINEVVSRLPRPDISLQQAVEEGLITEDQIVNLYESFSNLLENKDYQRILLYIPFEFFPNTNWETGSGALEHSIERFRSAYMTSWKDQLKTHDVRANFTNGDVLEVESRTGDLPRVVKAAHLIPMLVQNHFMSADDVLELMEKSDDEVLRQSIADSMLVLADLGLIDDASIVKMQASGNGLMKDTAAEITSSISRNFKKKELIDLVNKETLETLSDKLREIKNEQYDGITEKRAVWLRQEKIREAIESVALKLGGQIAHNKASDDLIEELIAPTSSLENQQTIVLSIRNAIESVATSDTQKAKELYAQYENRLLVLWQNNIPEIRDVLMTTFYHLRSLGIINENQWVTLDLPEPALTEPSSDNLSVKDKRMFREVLEILKSDEELMRFVYPTMLVFGSMVKGYSTANADVDIAVFVKPGTPFADKAKIQQALKNKLSYEKINGQVFEFWLDETSTGLNIHDFEKTDTLTGESFWTHVLFGAVWEGDDKTIKELREKLLVPYFYETDKSIRGRNARGLYLEEIERDTLQYRLMHKGYARFYPPCGGINTPHSNRIDGRSMFWDSGYRQMALKLFASRVFLPKLNK